MLHNLDSATIQVANLDKYILDIDAQTVSDTQTCITCIQVSIMM